VILLTTDPKGFYMDRPFYSNMIFDAHPFHQFVREFGDREGIAKRLREMGVDYVAAPGTGPLEEESWLPEEEKLTPKEWEILEGFFRLYLEPVFSTSDQVVYKMRNETE